MEKALGAKKYRSLAAALGAVLSDPLGLLKQEQKTPLWAFFCKKKDAFSYSLSLILLFLTGFGKSLGKLRDAQRGQV